MTPLKKRLLIGSTLLVSALLLIWWWRAPAPADSLRARFSFVEVLNASLRGKSNSAQLPSNVKEQMPATPPEIEPPSLIGYGEFTSPLASRSASGAVKLFRLGTGEYLLRLENLQVGHGPGLHVFFTGAAAPREVAIVQGDFIDLGELRAQSGDLNYVIPADIDLRDYRGVVIYSPYFREIYATSALTEAVASAAP